MGSEHPAISGELVRRWSLYLAWVFGSDVPESAYEASCDACVRGEEPPDDGWQEAMAQRVEAEDVQSMWNCDYDEDD